MLEFDPRPFTTFANRTTPTFVFSTEFRFLLGSSSRYTSTLPMFPNVQIEMEKHPPAQLSPSHSHLSCASTRTRARGYLYDDYAREIPALPTVVYPDSRALPQTIKKKSTLYIAAWLAVILFLIQLGGSLTDVPSTRLLEDLLCHEYYHDTTRGLLHEDKCLIDAVQSELNILATGVLLTTYLPGELCLATLRSLRVRWQ